MPEDPYLNREIRERIETVSDRVFRSEGRQEGHELVCAQRYGQILKELSELKILIITVAKVGLVVAAVLFMLEFGKATFPAIFEAISKGLHG